MQPLPHPEAVRERVLSAFGDLQRRAVARADVVETILLRQGHYYGRAYRHGALVATLTAETGTLCICTDDGRLLQSIALGADAPSIDRTARAA